MAQHALEAGAFLLTASQGVWKRNPDQEGEGRLDHVVEAHPRPLNVGLVVGQKPPKEIVWERKSCVCKLKDFPHHQQHDQAPVSVDCNISLQLLFYTRDRIAHSQILHAVCFISSGTDTKEFVSFDNWRLISFPAADMSLMVYNRLCKHVSQDFFFRLRANSPSVARPVRFLAGLQGACGRGFSGRRIERPPCRSFPRAWNSSRSWGSTKFAFPAYDWPYLLWNQRITLQLPGLATKVLTGAVSSPNLVSRIVVAIAYDSSECFRIDWIAGTTATAA
jgi:hypothetical protein